MREWAALDLGLDLRWLLVMDSGAVGVAMASVLRGLGREVVTVAYGREFVAEGSGDFSIRTDSSDDWDKVCGALRDRGCIPHRIVHLASLGPVVKTDRPDAAGYQSLLCMAQSMARQGWTARLHLDVLTCGLHDLEPGDMVEPIRATILGPCTVIPQEYANISCRCLDVGTSAGASVPSEPTIRRWVGELSVREAGPVGAIRGRHVWARSFEPRRLEALDAGATAVGAPLLPPGTTCLITGGLGDVGMALAGCLAGSPGARLLLVGRSPFPARESWDSWVEAHSPEDSVATKIRRIREWESRGARVMLAAADVSDGAAMQEVLRRAEAELGPISGIIHAAGHTSGVAIQGLTPDETILQFRPKVDGLRVLVALARARQLDFVLMTSSLASILGGLGFAAYSAANQYLDAVALQEDRGEGCRWISVDWDGWNFATGAVGSEGGAAARAELAMKPGEGEEAFARLLRSGVRGQWAVSVSDLGVRMEKWVRKASLGGALASAPASVTGSAAHARPDISAGYVAPSEGMESTVAAVWQEALGLARVGADDNFFELGGNSLIAVQILPRLREIFQVDLPVNALFDAPTIRQLASRIQAAAPTAAPDVNAIDELLKLVEGTAEQDLKSLLDGQKPRN